MHMVTYFSIVHRSAANCKFTLIDQGEQNTVTRDSLFITNVSTTSSLSLHFKLYQMSNRIIPIIKTLNLCVMASFLVSESENNRLPNNPPVFQQRLCWSQFINEKRRLGNFHRHLRMSLQSFNRLLSYIRPGLIEEENRAAGRGGLIIPELRLYCTLRFLAGGSYLDIHYFCGISQSNFYTSVWRVLHLINKCPNLHISFPQTLAECKAAAEGFRSVSSGDAITNCVSVVDGLLVRIITPSKKEAKNVRSFFSGHYQAYGMNIQGACDHLCRFTFLGVAGPGVMSDRDAIEQFEFQALIENLPDSYCVIGDCAYRPSEHLVPIFGGASALLPANDHFNFYASQCRIRIEMAFGLMKQKWTILQSPLRIKLRNVKTLMIGIAHLHNFCINERLEIAGAVPRNLGSARHGFSIFEEGLRVQHAEDAGVELEVNEFRNFSVNRIKMVERVTLLRLERPRRFP